MRDPRLPRRAVLVGLGCGLGPVLAGCTAARRGRPSPAPTRGTDDRATAAAVRSIAELATLYRIQLGAHAVLKGLLQPFLDDHRAHLAALGAAGSIPAASPRAASTPAVSKPGGSTPPAAPTPTAARAVLAAAEAAGAAERVEQTVTASPGLARLLAAIGGCEAAHASLLHSLP